MGLFAPPPDSLSHTHAPTHTCCAAEERERWSVVIVTVSRLIGPTVVVSDPVETCVQLELDTHEGASDEAFRVVQGASGRQFGSVLCHVGPGVLC